MDRRTFKCLRPDPQAWWRLFCFPHAGGGAGLFRRWLPAVPEAEVFAVQLPGREDRFREPGYTAVSAAVAALTAAFPPGDGRPVAFFGVSMGALLCYALARSLCEREDQNSPALLVVAGHRAPHLPLPRKPIRHLPDEEFLEALDGHYGGIPPAVREHPELMALLLPLLRADLTLCETYEFQEAPPLPCPIIALGGLSDQSVSRADLQAWRARTSSSFALHLLPAGHFLLQEQPQAVLNILRQALREHL